MQLTKRLCLNQTFSSRCLQRSLALNPEDSETKMFGSKTVLHEFKRCFRRLLNL